MSLTRHSSLLAAPRVVPAHVGLVTDEEGGRVDGDGIQSLFQGAGKGTHSDLIGDDQMSPLEPYSKSILFLSYRYRYKLPVQ